MSETKVITNNHPRDILYIWDFSKEEAVKVKEEFDWIKDWESAQFFKYNGDIYSLDEFLTLHDHALYPEEFKGWDGYSSDSYFSGVLVKWVVEEWGEIDTDHIIVARYCSV